MQSLDSTESFSPGKCTVSAPANIAFIKYWGTTDLERALPCNGSISMTLSVCRSRCTVELVPGPGKSTIHLAVEEARGSQVLEPPPRFRQRALDHLERLRAWARTQGHPSEGHWRVVTRNSFPAAAGLASSASGFAALTLAACGALGLDPDADTRSLLARRSGSGSASRSVLGGFVEWPPPDWSADAADAETTCVARQMAPAQHWDLADVIALVETGPKAVASLDGHRRAASSPHFAARQALLPARLEAVRSAVLARDLDRLGPLLEQDAIELHLIAMSSQPPIFYWQPATLAVLAAVRQLREDGCSAWSTMDAGANVHVICAQAESERVTTTLARVDGVHQVLRDRVGDGPRVEVEPFF